MALVVKNGRLINPATGEDKICDIRIDGTKITAIGTDVDKQDADILDATGLVVTPGLIDMHVHLRQPGQSAKETIESGTKAAAAGGFTRVATMPNTKPVIDSAIIVDGLKYKIADEGVVKVDIIGSLSKGLEGKELSSMGGMAKAGVVAFSDDGRYVQNCDFMRKAMEYAGMFGKIVIDHCEDADLIEAGQAKAKGLKVTAEATPQHMILTDEALRSYDPRFKVNPPLRSEEHRKAVVEGLVDGTIDAIVTDHAPHTIEEKDCEFSLAPSGFVGLETSLGTVLTYLYHTGTVDLMTLIRTMTSSPAALLGVDAGNVAVGKTADLTIMDLNKEWTVDSDKFYSKGKSTPFEDMILKGKAVATIVDGKIVMKDGEV